MHAYKLALKVRFIRKRAPANVTSTLQSLSEHGVEYDERHVWD